MLCLCLWTDIISTYMFSSSLLLINGINNFFLLLLMIWLVFLGRRFFILLKKRASTCIFSAQTSNILINLQLLIKEKINRMDTKRVEWINYFYLKLCCFFRHMWWFFNGDFICRGNFLINQMWIFSIENSLKSLCFRSICFNQRCSDFLFWENSGENLNFVNNSFGFFSL